MSVPNVSALAAALVAKLTPDPSIILEGLDPVPLPSDKTPRTQEAKPPGEPDPKPAKPIPPPAVQAVETARQTAAGRQTGIAPLMADLEQAIRTDVLPAPVKAAAEKVLSLQTPIEARVTPQTIKRALSQSGLFLEPRLAESRAAPPPDLKAALLVLRQVLRTAAPPPSPPTAQPAAPPAQPPAPPPLAAQAGASPPLDLPDVPPPAAPAPTAQPAPTGLARTYGPPAASLLPRVEPQIAAPAPAAPGSVAPTLPAAGAPTRPGQSVAAAGPPSAAPAPGASPPSAASQPASPFPHSAAPPLDRAAPQPQALALGAPPPDRPAPQTAAAALPLPGVPETPDVPAPAAQRPDRARAERSSHAAPEETPAPPVKGAPPGAQKAAQPHLPEGADPAALLRHLERATSGAIARTELFQLASLPDAPRADGEAATRQASWLFEVPLATPQGPAVAQFEIEKDGSNGEAGREGAAWRTRFSVDVEPLGLIHALLVLAGGKTTVTLWAERTETLARLRKDQADLAGAIEAEVAVYPGRPAAAKPTPGRFLDASS